MRTDFVNITQIRNLRLDGNEFVNVPTDGLIPLTSLEVLLVHTLLILVHTYAYNPHFRLSHVKVRSFQIITHNKRMKAYMRFSSYFSSRILNFANNEIIPSPYYC